MRVLCCGHTFHPPCIDEWLSLEAVCPLCKSRISARGEDVVQLDSDVPELDDSAGTTAHPDVEMP